MTTSENLQARRNRLSAEKRALLEKRLHGQIAPADETSAIPRRQAGVTIPASFAQQRLWFLEQLEPATATSTIPTALRIRGKLNISALQQSLDEIMRRHEILRTTFGALDGKPVQHVHATWSVPLTLFDFRTSPEEQKSDQVLQFMKQEVQKAFDLERGPSWRCTLFHMAEDEYILLLVMHHLISDGWSTVIFTREFRALYQVALDGESSPLADLPLQYADFACWQQEELQGQVFEKQLTYWKQLLEPLPEPLALPLDYPRPAVQTFRGAKEHFILAREVSDALRQRCQQEGITLFMALLAALSGFLSRYSGQVDLTLGTSIANRTRPELENLIGFFSNTLALRVDLTGNPTVHEFFKRVRQIAMDAYANQEVPFEYAIYRQLRLPVMLILQNTPAPILDIEDLSFEIIPLDTHTAMFDLLVNINDQPELTGYFEYNADLFEHETVERMLRHFQVYLTDMIANPAKRLSDVQMLSPAEQQCLLVDWNRTAQPFSQAAMLHALFEAQAEATPTAVAVIDGEQRITYQELNHDANQLAHMLRGMGVGPEVIVGLYLKRSWRQMAGVLAILKAGGAYLPLDIASPGEWLVNTLHDAQTQLVLTTSDLRPTLSTYQGTVLCLDSSEASAARYPLTNPGVAVAPNDLAYVIYTSGSTGRPKGVQVEHRSVVNHCCAIAQQYHLTSADRVVQFASLSFDAAAEELYPTWSCGATLVLRPDDLAVRLDDWHAWLQTQQISVLDLPTAYWHHWVSGLAQQPDVVLPSCLRLVIIGGEQALPERYARWKQVAGPQIQWSNTYGPTETTVTAVLYIPSPGAEENHRLTEAVPIGQPLANLTAYVLDGQLQPVPINVVGELYIGGVGVARGYLNRPDLTAECFLPNPYAQNAGERFYRTGDMVRYLPNGQLEYFGRGDQQVKIRGYRIELGEISSVLAQHPNVQECAVVAREDQPGDKYLAAYLTGDHLPDRATLQHFLKERLPAYMIPAAYVALAELPLTTSGKINLRALPAPDQESFQSQRDLVAPRNAVEEALVAIWQEVLGREQIGVEDNFFEIGGHSLLATQLMARVDQVFSVTLPLRLLFETPTIAHLAALLLQDEQEADQRLLTAQLFLQVAELSEEEIDALLQSTENGTYEGV
jgi:amino acid adenylation domain-containing protein